MKKRNKKHIHSRVSPTFNENHTPIISTIDLDLQGDENRSAYCYRDLYQRRRSKPFVFSPFFQVHLDRRAVPPLMTNAKNDIKSQTTESIMFLKKVKNNNTS